MLKTIICCQHTVEESPQNTSASTRITAIMTGSLKTEKNQKFFHYISHPHSRFLNSLPIYSTCKNSTCISEIKIK